MVSVSSCMTPTSRKGLDFPWRSQGPACPPDHDDDDADEDNGDDDDSNDDGHCFPTIALFSLAASPLYWTTPKLCEIINHLGNHPRCPPIAVQMNNCPSPGYQRCVVTGDRSLRLDKLLGHHQFTKLRGPSHETEWAGLEKDEAIYAKPTRASLRHLAKSEFAMFEKHPQFHLAIYLCTHLSIYAFIY